MIKSRIGKYLRELRNNYKWSQEDLANKINKCGGESISINSISDWEKGISYPTIDNLECLSKIYNKSIDEILDGEDYIDIDYYKEYFLSDAHWVTKFDDKTNLLKIKNENILKIVKRFKELLLIRIDREFSQNEENEFKFLFKNFYQISDYAEEEYANSDSNDSYLRIKSAIIKCLITIRNMNTQEKYWEFEKLFNEKEVIWFKYLYDIEELYSDESGILLKRFKNLDDWQKDLLLATFQNVDPISIEPDEHGSKFLKNYELRNKEQYEKDKYIKNRLMLMLKNGAKINKYFLNIKRKQTKKYRIIDRLEELYNICKKPIIASCSDEDGMTQNKGNHYLLENNSKNRFLNKYYFQLSKYFGEDYYSSGNYDDVEELYKFFMKYDSIPEKLKIELAKKYCEKQKYNIDYQQEERFLKAELLSHTKHIFETYDRFKEKEKKIQDSLKELKRLEELLNSGQKEYTVDEYDEIGGKDYVDIRNYIIFWKSSITYAEFLKHRDNRLTDDLIKNIDNLSIQEIREKYFKIEVEDND